MLTDLERTAFHEAGHAVVSWALRVGISILTIEAGIAEIGIPMKGETRFSAPKDNPFHFYVLRKPRSVALAKKHLAIKRAGIHAEMRAERMVYISGSEEMEAGPMEKTLEEIEPGIVRRMDIESIKILSRNWPAVKALTDELLRKKTMSGRAVRRLLNSLNGG